MENLNTYFELEAGSVVTKNEKGERLFLVIYRVKMDDYAFPKGHVEDGEPLEECATRETFEETGQKIKVIKPINSFEYKVKEEKNGKESYIIRRVYVFEAEPVDEMSKTNTPEENEGKIIPKWMTYDEVMSKLSYDGDKEAVKKIIN